MKSRKVESKKSLFAKKGFYTALYSCIGVFFVFAAVISFDNFNVAKEAEKANLAKAQKTSDQKTAEASKSGTDSYLVPEDKKQSSEIGEALTQETATKITETKLADKSEVKKATETKAVDKPEVKKATTETKVLDKPEVKKATETKATETKATETKATETKATEIKAVEEKSISTGKKEESNTTAKVETKSVEKAEAELDTSKTEKTETVSANNESNIEVAEVNASKTESYTVQSGSNDSLQVSNEPTQNVEVEGEKFIVTASDTSARDYYAQAISELEEDKPATFTEFASGDVMSYPLVGTIVMDYSMDHTIYDPTLQQYRTNDSLSISAEVGEEVKATAEGIVMFVKKTRQEGNVILVNNGNGYMTTYSQLEDDVLVKAGDVIEMGQVIGKIGSPSIYATNLGAHLNFKVSKDNVYIDPKLILAQQ